MKTCCYCLSLRTGTFLLGCFGIVAFFFTMYECKYEKRESLEIFKHLMKTQATAAAGDQQFVLSIFIHLRLI